MSQRGKRPSRLDNDEPPPTKKRKGRPPANKTNSSNLGNGNSVHLNATESELNIFSFILIFRKMTNNCLNYQNYVLQASHKMLQRCHHQQHRLHGKHVH